MKTKDNFTAYATPEHNYQFGGAMIESERLSELLKPAHQLKSPDEIKEELDKKKATRVFFIFDLIFQ